MHIENDTLTTEQVSEIEKCAQDFEYFCEKYVKIEKFVNHKYKLVDLKLYDYQKRYYKAIQENRFLLVPKFRQGGFSTVTAMWALWRCMFNMNEAIMFLYRTDRESILVGEIIKRAMDNLPVWMQPNMSKNNSHQKYFADTDCKLFFCTPDLGRGRTVSYLFIDEAAFISGMDNCWNAIYPIIASSGSVVAISTPSAINEGESNWFFDTVKNAKEGKNDFKVFDVYWWEHPEYNNKEWADRVRANVGDKMWRTEFECEFVVIPKCKHDILKPKVNVWLEKSERLV
jgi:hypothetical protein